MPKVHRLSTSHNRQNASYGKGETMRNKELFDIANTVNNTELKNKLRESYTQWCRENGKTSNNATTLMEWWNKEYKEEAL